MIKVSIIGTGSVGSTIAYSLAIMGVASEIVLIDINQERRWARRWTSARARRSSAPARCMPAPMRTRRIPTSSF